jgi:glucan 1,3-beta-glucosidase
MLCRFVNDVGVATVVGVHWQVAQATSISNVWFKMGRGSENQGMWMENGSGGYFNNLIIDGGKFGLWVGNQQFTSRNITIRDASVSAIYLNWNWVWTFVGLRIERSPIAIGRKFVALNLVLDHSH